MCEWSNTAGRCLSEEEVGRVFLTGTEGKDVRESNINVGTWPIPVL